jgi:hypothetical protein
VKEEQCDLMLLSASTPAGNTNKRTFPPLYTPSGDESLDRLAFIHILERLKVTVIEKNYPPTDLTFSPGC